MRLSLTEEESQRKRRAGMIFTPLPSEAYINSYMKRDEIFWRA